MIRYLFANPLTRRLARSERGQSIILLAFAFIALIAFVGLVTDVALLFVRYASLRRAVDAAAIAAAGQVREGSDYSNVTIAAQQYIELHNINPDSVLVETCETDIYYWREGIGPWEGDPHPEAFYPSVQPRIGYVGMPETELCDWDDPHKLVRVSAQIDSPTTFLSLIGIEAVTLEATSLSETAVLDIALVLDTSESMSNRTTSAQYVMTAGLAYQSGGTDGSKVIRPECFSNPSDEDKANPNYSWSRERWAGCCNDPGTGLVGSGELQTNGVFLPNGLIWNDANGNSLYDGASASPSETGVANNIAMSSSLANPDGFNFTTLICAPFKDVRDAARLFIKRLDFVRGDRVVLVTFDRLGVAYDPDGENPDPATDLRPLITDEATAVETLNSKIGVLVNDTGLYNYCRSEAEAQQEWLRWEAGDLADEPTYRPASYESLSQCGQTNIGGGILAANNALTDPIDIRREAVWVMIVLSDGAANSSDPLSGTAGRDYGSGGFCPWWTFCILDESDPWHWDECTENNPSNLYEMGSRDQSTLPLCNDNDPISRHFCLDWSTGDPDDDDPECGPAGHYDADDYARDMADFAGLVEVTPGGAEGNFIAMFSIAFGEEVTQEPTAAPLMRYIADAGDNGFINNRLQQDLREDRNPVPTYPVGGDFYPDAYGEGGPCEGTEYDLDPKKQCGQYYYANTVGELEEVFEEIAGRLFTRLSR